MSNYVPGAQLWFYKRMFRTLWTDKMQIENILKGAADNAVGTLISTGKNMTKSYCGELLLGLSPDTR